MLTLLLLAFLGTALIASSKGGVQTDVKNQITTGDSRSMDIGARVEGEDSDDRDVFLRAWSAHFAERGLPTPPEFPVRAGDLGEFGDIDALPDDIRDEVIEALFANEDPQALTSISDDAALAGYPIAANRLIRKALRLA
jgi:hypothetical protein